MSEPLFPLKYLELRDPTTNTPVGFLIPKQDLEEATRESRQRIAELEQQVRDLQAAVDASAQERDQLRHQVQILEASRAGGDSSGGPEEALSQADELRAYRQSLEYLTRERRPSFTAEELAALETDGMSLDEIIEQLP